MKNSVLIIVFIVSIMVTSCSNSRPPEGNIPTQDAIQNLMSRKSVRNYLEKPVEEEKVQILLKAGMAAPTGKDVRPWEFVVVTERSLLDAMAEALPYAKMLKQAPLAIVVCGDTTKSSYWYLDCSAATENILLAAEALQLGAVWTAAYPYEDRMAVVKREIRLPDHILPLCVVPVGYPAIPHSPKEKYDEMKIHKNQWE